ncbi:uncharacterized protein [Neodiprion pinetum]|uniref:uncharacterized protein n=1 Tax=Neodiprion pinetum TaxID=441929 RepID=UPI001EDC9AF7|nr:uncharacterized protein LOC124221212 [Neodiprion pinetum]XP_046623908.1 uncharacterized protein LOC124306856 [Neodiprion virginianus]
MKFYGIIVLLALVTFAHGLPTSTKTKRSISDNLVSLVESFQETMKTGDEDLGIPVLEPFEADSIDISIDETSVALDGNLSNLKVAGLSNFSIDTLTFSLIGIRFTFAFTWPSITFSTGYSIEGTVSNDIAVYGNGNATGEITNLVVSGTAALSVSNSYLYIRSLTSEISVEDTEFAITGIWNDDDVSKLIGDVVSDIAPVLVEEYQDEITTAVNEVVTEYANDYLGTMTLADLIGLLG